MRSSSRRNDTKCIPCSARFESTDTYCISPKAKATSALSIFALNQGELCIVVELEKPQGIKCVTLGAASIEDQPSGRRHERPVRH
ncbi:hypothetical protein PybrP1_011602 [[Pythium] brassicae (nom. inval.)]|nr:hypothetical protein PybrP1_011602 [[Pythium] brassicae (nom. inval.)]